MVGDLRQSGRPGYRSEKVMRYQSQWRCWAKPHGVAWQMGALWRQPWAFVVPQLATNNDRNIFGARIDDKTGFAAEHLHAPGLGNDS